MICLAAPPRCAPPAAAASSDISCRPLSACTRASTSGRCQGGVSAVFEPARHHHLVPGRPWSDRLAGHHARQMGAEVRHIAAPRRWSGGTRPGRAARGPSHRGARRTGGASPATAAGRSAARAARARGAPNAAAPGAPASGEAPIRASSSSNQGRASSGRAVRRRRGSSSASGMGLFPRARRARLGSAGEQQRQQRGLHAADAAHAIEAVHGLHLGMGTAGPDRAGVTLPVMMRVSAILRGAGVRKPNRPAMSQVGNCDTARLYTCAVSLNWRREGQPGVGLRPTRRWARRRLGRRPRARCARISGQPCRLTTRCPRRLAGHIAGRRPAGRRLPSAASACGVGLFGEPPTHCASTAWRAWNCASTAVIARSRRLRRPTSRL